jgi:hypothetical protein
MLDFARVDDRASARNESSVAGVTGGYLAKMRQFEARVRLAEDLIEGSVALVTLTPRQAAWLCRLPASALSARYRVPKPKKAVALRAVWDAAPVGERQDLLVDKIVLPLAG